MLNKKRIKVCGITNISDALECYRLGAHAIGLIFAPISPRFIDKDVAREIASSIPSFCEKVGVFVDEPIDRLLEISNSVGLSAIQLHGNESIEYVQKLSSLTNIPIIRAVRKPTLQIIEDIKKYQDLLQSVLIDGIDGVSIVQVEDILNLAVILAGGIGIENIKTALQNNKNIIAVDLCSSVESEPGKKDHTKLQQLFEIYNKYSA